MPLSLPDPRYPCGGVSLGRCHFGHVGGSGRAVYQHLQGAASRQLGQQQLYGILG
nr:hypothetical protein [Desulfofundulus australicus]